MILVDALYINQSGGLRLLTYLVNSLRERSINFHLLADKRCEGLFDNLQHVEYLHASIINRYTWYKHSTLEYTCVFCFGNLPAPFRLKIPVYTYFHCINYLTLKGLRSKKETIKSWIKREIYRHYKQNTEYWIVQTSNTKKELVHHLGVSDDRVKLLPFFFIPEELSRLSVTPHGDDYVYVAYYTGSKQHEELLDAWELLHALGLNKRLHLTIEENQLSRTFLEKVKVAQSRGVSVINHGFIPFEDVIKLYGLSKAIVYPSLNESLGLGIVEAIMAGCDVIGSDLPFIHSICKPSGVFDPHSARSIANAILEYERRDSNKSELLIRNQMDELLELLKK